MCFVWISKQTAIISLYRINRLVCITKRECVYCAVRTAALYIIRVRVFLNKIDWNVRVSFIWMSVKINSVV